MLRIIYTIMMYLLQPIILLFMLIRSIKLPAYRRRLNERYGVYPKIIPPKPKGIIIHAASVGEVIAATPLISRILQDHPTLAVTVTTVTPTGSERVKAAFGEKVTHVYLPYDLPLALRRFLNFIQPCACIVIETEIWPNLISQLHQRDIPFIIANARLSGRSARRYGWIKQTLQRTLQEIELIAAQDKVSGQRYLDLGYAAHQLTVTGNIKYDLTVDLSLSEQITQLKKQWCATRPCWIAASTHEGEESIILDAHRALLQDFPDLLLILVPRHPERFNTVGQLIEQGKFSYAKRSQFPTATENLQVILGDTMGELMLLYGIADLAFVGGSLVKHGGHNPLEPLTFKIPVISGRHTFNFPEVFCKLREVQGVLEINENATALAQAIKKFLHSPSLCERYGTAGHTVLIENRGALQRLLDLLRPYLEAKR